MEAAGVALAIPAIIELCLKYSYPSFSLLVGMVGSGNRRDLVAYVPEAESQYLL